MNKEKGSQYLHMIVSYGVVVMAEAVSGILGKDFTFTYLRCHIFHMRKKKDY